MTYNFPVNTQIKNYLGYTSYSALITQLSTSAPATGSVVNNFSPTTFTWARTTAGIYTVTANSGVFTANKTVVLMSPPLSSLNTFNAVITSTSVITITAGLSSVIATVLTNVPTDALLTNSLFEIRVYN